VAAGVDSDLSGNPWVFTFNGSTATNTLPYVVIGAQNTGNQAYPWSPKRIRWVSPGGGSTDQLIIKDYPGVNPTSPTPTAQRTVVHFVCTGAQFEAESRPRAHELYVGMDITQFDSGILYIYF
jgi:hypothetical protein